MYVIKRDNRYMKLVNYKYSFTKFIGGAYVFRHKKVAKFELLADKGEIIVKVTRNKQGKLVEVK